MGCVLLLLLFLLGCLAPVVWTYGSGLVADSCEDLHPRHLGLNPQRDAAPFIVTADPFREEVTVQLTAPDSKPFLGFLLQARALGQSSPLGSFSLLTDQAQLLNCRQKPNSTVSHTSKSPKTSFKVIWTRETSGKEKQIQFHASFVQDYQTFWVDITSPVLTFSEESSTAAGTHRTPTMPSAAPSVISSEGCGVTKVCFHHPTNCQPEVSADCYFLSAIKVSPSERAVHYEMTGRSDGYISFGFSHDQTMGRDDIYVCGTASDGRLTLQRYFSSGRQLPQLVPLGNVSQQRLLMHRGSITCSFTSSNTIHADSTPNSIHAGSTPRFYLMLAFGPVNNGLMQVHTKTFIRSHKVDIFTPQLVSTSAISPVIKAHGALLLIGWMITGSQGMLVARYLKGVSRGHKVFGKDVWFVVHVSLMSVTLAATTTAFILSFSYAKNWSGGVHPVLGCIVTTLCLVQVLPALLRCQVQHPLRVVFNFFHAFMAALIKLLAVAAIFTGLKLIDSSASQWLMKVMGGLLGWEVVFHTLLQVNTSCRLHPTEAAKTNVLLLVLFSAGSLFFLLALLSGIASS